MLCIEADVYRASDLPSSGNATKRLLGYCQYFGASSYLSGSSAREYLDVELFTANGISIVWQDYVHPVYTQLHGPFCSHLSVLDLLLNEGPQSTQIF